MDPRIILVSKNKRLALRLFLISRSQTSQWRKDFNLNIFSEAECKSLFRFTAEDIKIIRKLLLIPFKIVCPNGTTCTGLEGLCIVLRRLAYPSRLSDLSYIFQRGNREIGAISSHVLDYIFEKFKHLLENIDQWWLTNEQLEKYSQSIHAKGSPLKKCWGFIDGTVRAMCRPSKLQKECYNGHKRCHALKYQSVVTPNGLISNLYGPVPGRRHDSYILSESGVLPVLGLRNVGTAEPYCIYGDPAYPLRPELQCPFKGSNLTLSQSEFNKRMSSVRISVEWAFGKVLALWAFVDYKKNQKLYQQPIAKHFKVAVIFTNIHTCIYGSQVSDFFNLSPPDVTEYLKLPSM